jgi:hypothetical protein
MTAPPEKKADRLGPNSNRIRRSENRFRAQEYSPASLLASFSQVPDECGELEEELIARLSHQFWPLDIRGLALEYGATRRPFRPIEFVMFVTKRWQEIKRHPRP